MTGNGDLGFHKYDPEIHHRRSIRLDNYDYSQPGYYFVTICIHDRWLRLFGNVINGTMIENESAGIVRQCWNDLPNHYMHIRLDEFVIMPNHIHGVIQIIPTCLKSRAGLEPAPTETRAVGLPEIVRQLKTFSAKRINVERKMPGKSVWQRNYYEHIIRNEKSLYSIRKYIRENPLKWLDDLENHIDREIDYFQMTERGG